MSRKCVIASQNTVYAYKGTLYERATPSGDSIVHELDDQTAEALLGEQNTPWREVDDDGNIIANEADQNAGADAEADLAARTTVVDNTDEATGRTASQDAKASGEMQPVGAKKTISIGKKAKPGSGDLSVADLAANGGAADPTPTPAPAPAPEGTDGTEGAVEV